jgi:ABC-type transporter Mla maintaining outer membrane lipid asymmetry permease subunit MlaE
MLRLIELIGRTIIRFSEGLGKILILLFLTIKQLILPPLEIRNTFKQMLEIGVRSCTYRSYRCRKSRRCYSSRINLFKGIFG